MNIQEMVAAEYHVGDRVRVLVDGTPDIPRETKGNIVRVGDGFGQGLVTVALRINGHAIEGVFAPHQIEIVATQGDLERTRILQNVEWAGTNLPQELLQVMQWIRELIDAGHTYLYIEKNLMSLGFGFNTIRRAFQRLTGMRAEDAVNFDWQQSPGTIPQFTHGWGEGKKKGEYYFVMPGVDWYGVYCQEDDITRIETSRHGILSEAMEALAKLVKKVERWDPPVRDLKPKPGTIDPEPLKFNHQQIYMQAGRIAHALEEAKDNVERVALTKRAYRDGLIEEETRDFLLRAFGEDVEKRIKEDAAGEKVDEVGRHQMERSVADEADERTPDQFFSRTKIEKRYGVPPADVVATIMDYLDQRAHELGNFGMALVSFKYSTIQPAGESGTGTQKDGEDEIDVMNVSASVSVLLEISDRISGATQIVMTVFGVVRGKLRPTDMVKGLDDRLYALTDEGIAGLFEPARSMKQSP